MKNDTKEAEKLKEILAQTEKSPMVNAILAEEAAAIKRGCRIRQIFLATSGERDILKVTNS